MKIFPDDRWDTLKGDVVCLVVTLCWCHISTQHSAVSFTSLKNHPPIPSFPLLCPMFTSCWKPLPSFVNWLTSCPLWTVPTLGTVILFGNINHTDVPFELPNDEQQMTCPCGQNTALEQSFMSNADAYRLLLWALLGLSDRVMLLLSGNVFKCTNWVTFTAACLGHFWWTHWHEGITKPIVVCEDMCTDAAADSELLFFEIKAVKKQHVGDLIKAWRELKHHGVPIMPLFYPSDSDWFLRYSCLYMVKHFELLKAEEAISIWKPEKHPFPSLSLSVSLFVGLETKLIKN